MSAHILNRVRKIAVLPLVVVAISLTAFYCSPGVYANTLAYKSHPSVHQAHAGSVIVFLKVADQPLAISPFSLLEDFQQSATFLFNLPEAELLTNKALHVTAYLHNVFYVFTSIHAP